MESKTRFQRSFTPHIKFWSKVTLPGAIFWTFGYYSIKHRTFSLDFLKDSDFYLIFFTLLIVWSIGNYYFIYKPNLGQKKKNEF